jgi:hypothetical protein
MVHSSAPGTHSVPTTHSTAPAALHPTDPSSGLEPSSSHSLSSGLTTPDPTHAATPAATHDTTHTTTDHTAVQH